MAHNFFANIVLMDAAFATATSGPASSPSGGVAFVCRGPSATGFSFGAALCLLPPVFGTARAASLSCAFRAACFRFSSSATSFKASNLRASSSPPCVRTGHNTESKKYKDK